MKYAYYPGCSLHSTAKDYDMSTRAVCRALGIELEEIPGWICCGASSAHMTSELLSLSLAVKNLVLAKEMGLEPLGSIKSYASGGVDPAYMGLGPIPAIKRAMVKAKLTLKDMDVIELNEVFASQAIACIRELGLDMDKTNPLGSGISLGHPIGCTGARLVVTILHDMKRRNLNMGLVSMCIGGGQGMAMVIGR